MGEKLKRIFETELWVSKFVFDKLGKDKIFKGYKVKCIPDYLTDPDTWVLKTPKRRKKK